MSVRKRVFQALAANTFGQAITIGAQLLLTPLYFSSWGAAQYGEWLLLSTIPAYLVMVDIGLGSAAANEMAMQTGAGNYEQAQRTFWGAVRLCHLVAMVTLAIAGCLAWLANLVPELPRHHIARDEASAIVLLLGVGVALNFYLGLVAAGFRSSGKNALGIFYANTLRLLEFGLAAGLLLLQVTPLFMCLGLALARALGLLVQTLLLRSGCGWIFRPGHAVDRHLLSRLIRPSLSFLALPLGNALALQGPVLIMGLLFGSTAVATFSTLRTLSRIPLQITNVFNASIWPEMSAAFGAGNLALLRKLHQQSWLATVLLGLAASISIVVLGKAMMGFWLGRDGVYDATMLMALTSMASFASVWGVSAVVLTAINAHTRLVVAYLLANFCALGLAYLLGQWLGMQWFLLPLVLAELVMLCVVYPMALRASGDSVATFFCSEWANLRSALHTLRAS